MPSKRFILGLFDLHTRLNRFPVYQSVQTRGNTSLQQLKGCTAWRRSWPHHALTCQHSLEDGRFCVEEPNKHQITDLRFNLVLESDFLNVVEFCHFDIINILGTQATGFPPNGDQLLAQQTTVTASGLPTPTHGL